jgi:putative oxidoreductase
MNSLSRYADTVFCLLRLIVGLMFACHGGQKLLGFPPGGHGGEMDTLSLIGAWIELVGGFMVALGFLTRVAAFLTSGQMAVGYFMAHAQGGWFPIQNHGELAVLYCWVFLFVFFHGPGSWSIDALLGKGRQAAPAAA